MVKLTFFQKLFLNEKIKILVEADYMTPDLQLTERGVKALNKILVQANLDEIVKMATERVEWLNKKKGE